MNARASLVAVSLLLALPVSADTVKGCIYADGISFSSLCSDLQTDDLPGGGVSTGNSGMLCYNSSHPSIGTLLVCGSQLLGLGATDSSWPEARSAIADLNHFPGVYNWVRGAQTKPRLDQDIANKNQLINQLKLSESDLLKQVGSYEAETASKALRASLDETRKLNQQIGDVLEPALSASAQIPVTASRPGVSLPETPVSAPVRELEQRIQAGHGGSLGDHWKDLSTVYRLHGSAEGIPALDRAEIDRIYQDNFDKNGLLKTPDDPLLPGLSPGLQTPPDSPEGDAIRYEIDRGYVAYRTVGSHDLRQAALGGIALEVGADQAFAHGDVSSGRDLTRLGAEVIDFSLGLIPGIASINDLTQIVHGMLTGVDWAGNPMAAADYALRGVGVALGVCGGICTEAGKATLEIGGLAIDTAFTRAAGLVREFGLGERVAEVLKPFRSRLVEWAEALGSIYSGVSPHETPPTENLTWLGKELEEIVDDTAHSSSWQRLPAEQANAAFIAAGDEPPYKAGTSVFDLTLKDDVTVFRIHGDQNQLRPWVENFDPRSFSKPDLKNMLSIPGSIEDMKYVTEFKIPAGTPIRGGIAAPVEPFGTNGGAFQWQILTDVQSTWIVPGMDRSPF